MVYRARLCAISGSILLRISLFSVSQLSIRFVTGLFAAINPAGLMHANGDRRFFLLLGQLHVVWPCSNFSSHPNCTGFVLGYSSLEFLLSRLSVIVLRGFLFPDECASEVLASFRFGRTSNAQVDRCLFGVTAERSATDFSADVAFMRFRAPLAQRDLQNFLPRSSTRKLLFPRYRLS